MNVHLGKKDYECLICSKKFINQSKLNRHMKVHTGLKEHNCLFCGSTFCQESNLRRHMTVMHKEIVVQSYKKM